MGSRRHEPQVSSIYPVHPLAEPCVIQWVVILWLLIQLPNLAWPGDLGLAVSVALGMAQVFGTHFWLLRLGRKRSGSEGTDRGLPK